MTKSPRWRGLFGLLNWADLLSVNNYIFIGPLGSVALSCSPFCISLGERLDCHWLIAQTIDHLTAHRQRLLLNKIREESHTMCAASLRYNSICEVRRVAVLALNLIVYCGLKSDP